MPPDHRRSDRVAEAIREEVATFLGEGVKDPRVVGLVTVTGVDVTRDLRSAKVYVSILGSDVERQATFEGLESLAGHLRSRLGRSLRLRVAPEIQFKEDQSVTRAARIETLLAQVREEEEAKSRQLADMPTPDADATGDGERDH
jgi:ribosome-binding factor A